MCEHPRLPGRRETFHEHRAPITTTGGAGLSTSSERRSRQHRDESVSFRASRVDAGLSTSSERRSPEHRDEFVSFRDSRVDAGLSTSSERRSREHRDESVSFRDSRVDAGLSTSSERRLREHRDESVSISDSRPGHLGERRPGRCHDEAVSISDSRPGHLCERRPRRSSERHRLGGRLRDRRPLISSAPTRMSGASPPAEHPVRTGVIAAGAGPALAHTGVAAGLGAVQRPSRHCTPEPHGAPSGRQSGSGEAHGPLAQRPSPPHRASQSGSSPGATHAVEHIPSASQPQSGSGVGQPVAHAASSEHDAPSHRTIVFRSHAASTRARKVP